MCTFILCVRAALLASPEEAGQPGFAWPNRGPSVQSIMLLLTTRYEAAQPTFVENTGLEILLIEHLQIQNQICVKLD